MENVIIIISIITAAVCAALYIFVRKEISDITKKLSEINNSSTNSKILVSSSDTEIRKLAVEINKTLDEKSKTEVKYKRMDTELREAIANISHDLRTPLTSIMGYIQLIEDDRISEDEKKEYIGIIKRRSESLQMLISGFYELSRLESNEYEFELKPLNLSDILCDIIASFYNDFVNHGIEPCIHVDQSAAMIIADEVAVRRVFSNLIQNMLKYSKSSVYISQKMSKDQVITIFKNDAPNLNEDDVPHLFERFFTADRTRNGNNTGLGLAIAKKFIEEMGHKIYAELDDRKLSIIIIWKL